MAEVPAHHAVGGPAVTDNQEESTMDQSQGDPQTVVQLMNRWRPGSHDDDWTWADEKRDLWSRDSQAMCRLQSSIRMHGFRPAEPGEEPIILGNDGRLWSGHHRILAAASIDLDMRLPAGTLVVRHVCPTECPEHAPTLVR